MNVDHEATRLDEVQPGAATLMQAAGYLLINS